jgi:hypothetical protein
MKAGGGLGGVLVGELEARGLYDTQTRTGTRGLAAAAALGLRLVGRVEPLDIGNVNPSVVATHERLSQHSAPHTHDTHTIHTRHTTHEGRTYGGSSGILEMASLAAMKKAWSTLVASLALSGGHV